jgi:hypothetical protein
MTDDEFNRFLAELEELCKKHGVWLGPSHHDALEVWPIAITNGRPIDRDNLNNRTKR